MTDSSPQSNPNAVPGAADVPAAAEGQQQEQRRGGRSDRVAGRGRGRGRDEGESRGFGRTCWGFSPFTFSRVAMFRFLSRVYPELPASLRGGYRSGLASSHARAREVFVANRRGLSAPLLSLNPPPWGFRVLRRASVERNLSFASLRCERRRRVSARDSSKV